MNVAVYCGANFGKGERYRQAAKAMGHWIAENGAYPWFMVAAIPA